MTFEEEFPSAKQYNRTNWASRDWEKFCLHHMKDEQRVREALNSLKWNYSDNGDEKHWERIEAVEKRLGL